MVNEKNADVQHDFATDPIRPERDGDYLKATGTTLGADNGIGVAAMLAIMEADDITTAPRAPLHRRRGDRDSPARRSSMAP
jgi:dipeptidase D